MFKKVSVQACTADDTKLIIEAQELRHHPVSSDTVIVDYDGVDS